MRNLSVAIGNSTPTEKKISILQSKFKKISAMVDEHIVWAINRLRSRLAGEQGITDQGPANKTLSSDVVAVKRHPN